MRRLSALIISLVACAVLTSGLAFASPAHQVSPTLVAAAPIQVDAARACAEQGTPGVATVYPRGILCGGWGWGAGYKTGEVNGQVHGSANPWRYCSEHYRRGASYQLTHNRWLCI